MNIKFRFLPALFLAAIAARPALAAEPNEVGVGVKPIDGAEVIIDGTRKTLDEKWTYWEGPRFASSLPIKWQIVNDPVDTGTVLMTDDRAADGGHPIGNLRWRQFQRPRSADRGRAVRR